MNDRQKQILDILKKDGSISTAELSKRMFVCEMTVRRDLKELEARALIKRFHGGAVGLDDGGMPIERRRYLNEDEKKELCRRAQVYLRDDISIYIDSSSTCLYLIEYIKDLKNIKLFTNSITALMKASTYHIPCYLIGGDYFEPDRCFVGPTAEELCDKIFVDIAFVSMKGISNDGIISDPNEEQLAVRRRIMNNSQKNVLLFDKSKQNKRYSFILCRESDDVVIIKS